MHHWGLTIDTISCVNLVISVGLCVDYAAHIAHAFLVAHGPYSCATFNCAVLIIFFQAPGKSALPKP